jgi:CubicO group peptidase (beta-lactamase class C family)
MCLEDGVVSGERVVPADWIARVRVRDAELIEAFRTSTAADASEPDAFYHDKWWVYDGPRGVYAALGMNGQSILVHRPARIVIAKFSTFPDALDDSLFKLHDAGMLALCDSLA